jgi:cell shape-determining protein MreC
MIHAFKGKEIEEERAKNAELRRQLDVFKRRVALLEGKEGNVNSLKKENDDLKENYKSSEKIRK